MRPDFVHPRYSAPDVEFVPIVDMTAVDKVDGVLRHLQLVILLHRCNNAKVERLEDGSGALRLK